MNKSDRGGYGGLARHKLRSICARPPGPAQIWRPPGFPPAQIEVNLCQARGAGTSLGIGYGNLYVFSINALPAQVHLSPERFAPAQIEVNLCQATGGAAEIWRPPGVPPGTN